jgi:trimeric autotransporter adhesin
MRGVSRTIHAGIICLVLVCLVIILLLYTHVRSIRLPASTRQAAPQDTPAPQPPKEPESSNTLWSSSFVAPNVQGYIKALALRGSELYVGGKFGQLGKRPAFNVGLWNGESWSPLGITEFGNSSDEVSAIAIAGSKVFFGGHFSKMGTIAANNIAVWDENRRTWLALGNGVTTVAQGGDFSQVYALAVSGDTLYVGGDFTDAGGMRVNNVARWNITRGKWLPMSTGFDDSVYALVARKGEQGDIVYAGGLFRHVGSDETQHLAEWHADIGLWTPIPDGVEGAGASISALALRGNDLYVGGKFATAGGKVAANFALWSTVTGVWTRFGNVGSAVDEAVEAIALSKDGKQLYVGGRFQKAGDVTARNIANWNGTKWLAVNSTEFQGTDGMVAALVSDPLLTDHIYVAGHFSYVNGDFEPSNGLYAPAIASLRNRQWSALGLGISCVPLTACEPGIAAMASDAHYLYVTGAFNRAGGVKVKNIARFDGNQWEDLNTANIDTGEGLQSVALLGDNVYVAGRVTVAGPTIFNGIARYNTTSKQWSGLGAGPSNGVTGLNNTPGGVHSLAVSGNKLYVGGAFLNAGGKTSYYAAVWDGSNWQSLTTLKPTVSARRFTP